MKHKIKVTNQATPPRPKNPKEELKDPVRVFLKQNGSSILIAENISPVSARVLIHRIENYVKQVEGKLNGKFYTVR